LKYVGSKARFAKEILPIILENKNDRSYIEPFAGGMNVIDKVDGVRFANDNNKYLIAMWKGILSGVVYPEEIPKDLYSLARDVFNGKEKRYEHTMNMTDDIVGWIGFIGSANGRFFEGGYSGKSVTKIGTTRDYIAESVRNIKKQIPNMEDITFTCKDYKDVFLPKDSIVYCDIPYKGTTQYSTSKGFNHSEFWDWAREKSLLGFDVFISEYEAPDDFECIWEKEAKSSLSANGIAGKSKTSVEKLFKYKEELK